MLVKAVKTKLLDGRQAGNAARLSVPSLRLSLAEAQLSPLFEESNLDLY